MGISKKRQYLNIGIVIVVAIGIYIFKFPFKPVNNNIEERGVTDELGLRQGTWEGFEDGRLFYRRTYVNDTIHGPALQFYEDESISSKSTFYKGNLIDTTYSYHSNGQLSNVDYYDSTGRLQGVFKIFYDNGQLRQIGRFLNSRMDGESFYYYPDGKLMSYSKYDSGQRVGTWIELSEQGDTTQLERYEHGELLN